jgi:cellular nucleic acid-binding protein
VISSPHILNSEPSCLLLTLESFTPQMPCDVCESKGPRADVQTAKQCYHCQGLGHVQADCPTLRLSGAGTSGRCYSCGLAGHLARNCPNPGMGRGAGGPPRGGFAGGMRGGFAGGARAATCYKCGGPNHFARDCQAQAMKWLVLSEN